MGGIAIMLVMAASSYCSAVAVLKGGIWLFGDIGMVRVIIGPLAVFAGFAGMFAGPALLIFCVEKVGALFQRK